MRSSRAPSILTSPQGGTPVRAILQRGKERPCCRGQESPRVQRFQHRARNLTLTSSTRPKSLRQHQRMRFLDNTARGESPESCREACGSGRLKRVHLTMWFLCKYIHDAACVQHPTWENLSLMISMFSAVKNVQLRLAYLNL